MISAQNIIKSYDKEVLHGVSLRVEQGQTVALIGPSGCGKSTLLRIIMGLITPDSGEVVIGDEIMTESNQLAIRRKMGYVIQKGGLFPHLTARQNLCLVTNFLGWSEEEENHRINELGALTDIPADLMNRKPENLSGGQTQRISLMRALMLDPEIILLDEPLGSIDPLVRYELQNDLKAIFKELNKTVLLVTHDLGEAAYLGDSIALMQSGDIIQKGTIREITEAPANDFVRQFVTAQRSPLADLG